MSSPEELPTNNSDHNYAKSVKDHNDNDNDDHDETGPNLNQFESTHLTKICLITRENNILRQLFRNFDRINSDGVLTEQQQQLYRILKRKYRKFLRKHPRTTFTDLYADFCDNFPMFGGDDDDDGDNSIRRHSDDDEEFYGDGGRHPDGDEDPELQFDEEELKLFEKWWKYDGDGGGLEGTSTTYDRPRRPSSPVIVYRCDFIGCQFETGRFDSMNRHNYTMHIVGDGAQLPEDYDNFDRNDDNDEDHHQDYQRLQQPMDLDSDLQNELADFFSELENWPEQIDDGDANEVDNDRLSSCQTPLTPPLPSSTLPTNLSSSSSSSFNTNDLPSPPPSNEHCLPSSSSSEMHQHQSPPPAPSNLNDDNVQSDGQTKSAEELLLPCPLVNTTTCTQPESDDGGDSDDTVIVTDEDGYSDSDCDTDADQVVNDGGPLEVTTNHAVDRPVLLQCPFDGCNYIANCPARLKLHQVVHTDQRPHHCSDCLKSYKLLAHLKQHRKYHHQGMARLSCPYDRCSKSYSYKSRLDEHVRNVHGAQLLRCTMVDGCDFTTCYKHHLQQHLTSMHSDQREFRCDLPDCGKSFKLSSNLTAHQKSVHQGVRFWCQYDDCVQSYTSKQNLDNHMKRDHTESTDEDQDLDVQQDDGRRRTRARHS